MPILNHEAGKLDKPQSLYKSGFRPIRNFVKSNEKNHTLNIDARDVLKILSDIRHEQINISTPYFAVLGRFPPDLWKKQAGLYGSFIKMNLKGKASSMRPLINIPDDNAFVTMFVTQFLAESLENSPSLPIDRRQIKNALDAINTHQDKNRSGKAIYRFWNQTSIQGRSVSWPANIAIPLTQAEFLMKVLSPGVQKLPEKIGPVNRETLKTVMGLPSLALQVFSIPPDFDDTFVNLALRARLSKASQRLPNLCDQQEVSSLAKDATQTLFKYSYQPFSTDRNHNLIDSRTYHWLRDFIHAENNRAKHNMRSPQLTLPTTWVLNHTENLSSIKNKESMPFGVNNVEGSVAANVLFGITSAVLLDSTKSSQLSTNNNINQAPKWFDKNTKALYTDTSRMLTWILEQNLMSHPEKSREILLYYPSVFDFYYFVARTNHLLENPSILGTANSVSKEPVLLNARNELGNALRNSATKQLLAKSGKDIRQNGNWVYWDDKLGFDDINLCGKPTPHHDDRLFSTSAALNALLDIWTRSIPDTSASHNAQSTSFIRKWVPGVPPQVQQTILDATRFLKAHSGKNSYGGLSRENIFFSGSTHAGLPMARPCNVREYLNGEKIPKDGPFPSPSKSQNGGNVHGVSGIIDQNAYEAELQDMKTKGYYKPSARELNMDSEGAAKTPFPFWSSPSVTMGLMMLALLKVRNLEFP